MKRNLCYVVGLIAVLLFTQIAATASNDSYDPWMDLNDDGIIDPQDLQLLASIYSTSGTPINKTALLLELEARINNLNTTLLTDYYNITECDVIFVDASGDIITGYLNVDSGTLYVDNVNDRVGIGTTNPDSDLEVYTGLSSDIRIRGDGAGQKSAVLTFWTNAERGRLACMHDGDQFSQYLSSLGKVYLGGGGINNQHLTVDTSGNIGIGTTSPTAKLDVAGDAKVSDDLDVDSGSLYVDSATDNVGIGTNSPAEKLDVNGTVKAESFVGDGSGLMNVPYLGYNSDWINITEKCGEYFNVTHNLNSTDIIVDIQGKTTTNGGVHQKYLGLTGYTPGWSKTYGGANPDYPYSVVQTSDGGYAIAGGTGGNFLLIKADAAGIMQWNRTYGGGGESAFSVIQTSDAGYAMVGQTYSYGAGDADFWLVKIDSSGNMEWNETYGGANFDLPFSVVQTSDGGYAMAGETRSFGAGAIDGWLVKTDSAGNAQWNRTYGSINPFYSDSVYHMIYTDDEGYAMVGRKLVGAHHDFWLIKTNSTGHMEWQQTYTRQGSTGNDAAESVVQTSDGGYVVVGNGGSPETNGNFMVVKTDASGIREWNKQYGGAGTEAAYSVVQTSDGGYAVAGKTNSYGVGTPDHYNAWLVKTDSLGNLQWNRTDGGAEYDEANSVILTPDGGYALVGRTESFGAGGGDFWLVKTEAESGLAWMDSTADTITLYRGVTDIYWNYVRVRIQQVSETP